MKKLSYLYALAILGLFSCGNSEEKGVIKNDIENTNCWINGQTATSETSAHSGKLSSKIDSVCSYSVGLSKPIKEMVFNPSKVDISCWLKFVKPNTNAQLVVGVDSLGTSLFWQGLPFDKVKDKLNDWVEFKETVNFPRHYNDICKINIIVWSPKGDKLYVDDLNFQFQ